MASESYELTELLGGKKLKCKQSSYAQRSTPNIANKHNFNNSQWKKKKKRQNGNNLRLVDPLRPSKPNTQIHQKYQKLLAIYKTHKGDNFSVSDENASSLPLDPLIPKREDS